MKIRIDVEGAIATGHLDEGPASRDFVAQLPLSLTLTNYARIERIAYLPSKLGRDTAGQGESVVEGDIAYYSPWGNVAFFVEPGTAEYTGGLVRLGRIDSGLSSLKRPGPLNVRIERAD